MSNTIKRWVIIAPATGEVAIGETELYAWWNHATDSFNQGLCNPIHIIDILNSWIENHKLSGYRAVEKTYKEVEE